jgi:hypothetical protein
LEALERRALLAAVISVGDHVLSPNKAGQQVKIFVSGGVSVPGVNLECQVADGGVAAGGKIAGPRITAVDILSSTIFANNNTGQRGGLIVPQVFEATTTTSTGNVITTGLLATLTIDTTGFSGGTFDLKLGGTVNGATDFTTVGATITNGHLTLGGTTTSTGTIAGNVFNDANANGAKNTGEAGLAGVKVFLDSNKNGALDPGERSLTSNASGNYTFTGLAAGGYRVRSVTPSGYRVTAPSSGYSDVTLASGQAVGGKNFALTKTIRIAGNVFNDLNGDAAKASGDPNLSQWRVFIDANHDGVWQASERNALTDTNGNYAFNALPAGSYRIAQQLQTGWRRTKPSAAYYDVNVGSGGTASGKTFGNTQKILISGTVFNDLDNDRVKDAGENGLSGWRVFIDANGDGVWQSSEKSTLSNASGGWAFKDLVAGTYKVRVASQSGWTRTTPTAGYFSLTLGNGGSSTGKLFGQHKV